MPFVGLYDCLLLDEIHIRLPSWEPHCHVLKNTCLSNYWLDIKSVWVLFQNNLSWLFFVVVSNCNVGKVCQSGSCEILNY